MRCLKFNFIFINDIMKRAFNLFLLAIRLCDKLMLILVNRDSVFDIIYCLSSLYCIFKLNFCI